MDSTCIFMSKLNYATKSVCSIFEYTNANDDLWTTMEHVINGRTCTIHGLTCSSTCVGILYKVFDHSINQFKYILHVGVETQQPYDNVGDIDLAFERAMEIAMTDPTMVIDLGIDSPSIDFESIFENLCISYIEFKPKEFILTDEEIQVYESTLDRYGKKYPYDWMYFNIYNRVMASN